MAVVEKGFATEVAHERLGGTVTQHVRFQLVVLDEPLAAELTGEGFLPCVNPDVPLQVLLEGETRPTGLAGKAFSSVDRLVRSERPPHGEGFATHAALERMLAGVDPPVALQGEGVAETAPALGARVRLLNAVNRAVSLQVAFGFEGLPAGGAHERPQVSVDDLVGL